MSATRSLSDYLQESDTNAIFAIARYMEEYIAENGSAVLERNLAKLQDAYAKAGDAAYGTYCNLLFRPLQKALKEAGFRPVPRFPGDFEISREWGVPDETDQQRWMWSTIQGEGGEPIGTIVTVIFHDHTRFRIPRAPQVIALAEVSQEAVVDALSRRSDDFKNAREASIEIAEYLASQNAQR
jgi:hypothetical protein